MTRLTWEIIDTHIEGGKSVCECGHRGDGPNSDHAGTCLAGREVIDNGHGACRVEGCNCRRFSWDHFVAEEAK